ncbi:hypothetical protein DAPPUDRAFT_265709 [Daphnia pulex]|uniref:Uncharacterized protein n=1 Tax=Daphnia pulex TaxID=6669 RepID=E9HTW8_DAPPU|nr:hypothetical protein DAPPUDRAFT_270195 [Daphnia pulex]EFX64812.1 hypothetical protein DAPPUDRAFT_265709 [Daphnia pulex]|eukprot:EFX62574.1 hypothetical protein DAPPUDRAFT_270195 [Daphnia pulex]
MGYGNKGDYTGGDGAHDGPPAMKARYTGPPCDFCTTKGTIATQPVSGYRKKVHAFKRDSANTAFLLPPFVDFGPPVSSSVTVYRDPSNWFDNSGARAQLTNQTNLQHNLVPVLVGSWKNKVIKVTGFRAGRTLYKLPEEKELQFGKIIVLDNVGNVRETYLSGASYYVTFKDKNETGKIN